MTTIETNSTDPSVVFTRIPHMEGREYARVTFTFRDPDVPDCICNYYPENTLTAREELRKQILVSLALDNYGLAKMWIQRHEIVFPDDDDSKLFYATLMNNRMRNMAPLCIFFNE